MGGACIYMQIERYSVDTNNWSKMIVLRIVVELIYSFSEVLRLIYSKFAVVICSPVLWWGSILWPIH